MPIIRIGPIIVSLGILAVIALILLLIFGGSLWLANLYQSVLINELERIAIIVFLVFVAIIIGIIIYPPEGS